MTSSERRTSPRQLSRKDGKRYEREQLRETLAPLPVGEQAPPLSVLDLARATVVVLTRTKLTLDGAWLTPLLAAQTLDYPAQHALLYAVDSGRLALAKAARAALDVGMAPSSPAHAERRALAWQALRLLEALEAVLREPAARPWFETIAHPRSDLFTIAKAQHSTRAGAVDAVVRQVAYVFCAAFAYRAYRPRSSSRRAWLREGLEDVLDLTLAHLAAVRALLPVAPRVEPELQRLVPPLRFGLPPQDERRVTHQWLAATTDGTTWTLACPAFSVEAKAPRFEDARLALEAALREAVLGRAAVALGALVEPDGFPAELARGLASQELLRLTDDTLDLDPAEPAAAFALVQITAHARYPPRIEHEGPWIVVGGTGAAEPDDAREAPPKLSRPRRPFCNLCGRHRSSGSKNRDLYGLEAEAHGGYWSPVLEDLTTYAFALCEPCLGALFERCVRKPAQRVFGSAAPFRQHKVPKRPKVPKPGTVGWRRK